MGTEPEGSGIVRMGLHDGPQQQRLRLRQTLLEHFLGVGWALFGGPVFQHSPGGISAKHALLLMPSQQSFGVIMV